MDKQLVAALSVICAATSVGCDPAGNEGGTEAPTIVVRDKAGRAGTAEDLRGMTGESQYGIQGTGSIPAEAEALHQEARAAGARGDYAKALKLLADSSELAPNWAYPLYDTAFTYLLRENYEAAREHYRKTIELQPRGFFTAITALDTLTRERDGDLPEGTYLRYLSLEWMDDPAQRAGRVRALVEELPQFAPAWKELAMLLDDYAERLEAIEKGLAASPDAETKGILEINKALVFARQGKQDESISILRGVVRDPACTFSNEQLAKAALAQLQAT